MSIKAFLASSAKTALAIFLALLLLTIVVSAGLWVFDSYIKKAAKEYEVPKLWLKNLTENIQLKFAARTKLSDGTLYVSVEATGNPEFLSNPQLAAINDKHGSIVFLFYDETEFKILEKKIPLSEFAKIVGNDGKTTGLHAEFNLPFSIEKYKKIAALNVQWNLVTQQSEAKAPRPATKPSPSAKVDSLTDALADHCAPGLGRAERLRRLAMHGPVREIGYGNFSAGSRSLMIFGDDVMRCN